MVDGGKVKHWRLARALNQRELATLAKISQDAVSEIEQGRRQPHPATIRKLAEALDVDPQELLKGKAHEGT